MPKRSGQNGKRQSEGGSKEIDAPKDDLRAGWQSWMGFGIAAIGIAMVVGFGAYVISLLSALEEQDRAVLQLQEQIYETGELMTVLGSRRLQVVTLSSPESRTARRGRLYLDLGNGKGVLQVSGLPVTDSEYRLWMVNGENPVPITSFEGMGDKMTYVVLPEIAQREQAEGATFVLTAEPEGVREIPAGPLVLAGSAGK